MAIAWESIRKQDGNVSVETWPGAGTRFTITLPDAHLEAAQPESWKAVSKT
jgi:hypothetical protein